MRSGDFPPDDPWTTPPELSASTPRRLKWTGAAILTVVWTSLYLFCVLAIVLATFDSARRGHLLPYWVPLVSFGFWIFLAALAVLPIRKERRLLRYGEPVAGVVTSNPQGRVPKYGYVLKYEFQLPDGSTVDGRTQRDARLHNGALVSIVYDPAKPRRNDLYPTRLFRVRQ
ncbi:MAG TPA: hypothetical protein VL484_04045 [Vicinamibacterales bacterium]|jgi:hypothetical protein|nr:hypothetical protein [Vicinamibacterales bacterium]